MHRDEAKTACIQGGLLQEHDHAARVPGCIDRDLHVGICAALNTDLPGSYKAVAHGHDLCRQLAGVDAPVKEDRQDQSVCCIGRRACCIA